MPTARSGRDDPPRTSKPPPVASRRQDVRHARTKSAHPQNARSESLASLDNGSYIESHTCTGVRTTSPRCSGPPPEDSPLSPRPPGARTEALPGRPEGSGLVHCVCERDRTVKVRGPHVSPSAAPPLTALGKSVGRFFFAGDVHTDVHTDVHKRTWDRCEAAVSPSQRSAGVGNSTRSNNSLRGQV